MRHHAQEYPYVVAFRPGGFSIDGDRVKSQMVAGSA
jgi:hypothetical protein